MIMSDAKELLPTHSSVYPDIDMCRKRPIEPTVAALFVVFIFFIFH
jgi:hypothetical protein